jgi:hypothetical protein
MWLLVDAREVFLAFEAFPWFRDASIAQLARIERPGPDHLRWPDLDVDLSIHSLDHRERYPLVSGVPVEVRESHDEDGGQG